LLSIILFFYIAVLLPSHRQREGRRLVSGDLKALSTTAAQNEDEAITLVNFGSFKQILRLRCIFLFVATTAQFNVVCTVSHVQCFVELLSSLCRNDCRVVTEQVKIFLSRLVWSD
jgi:hypothetical protein